MGEYRDKTPSVIGYDPSKKGKPIVILECPHCWFATRAKNILSRHLNQFHWKEKNGK